MSVESSRPLVSVCMIAYNQEAFIEESLVSALEQDYDRLQVVVADDASRDNTARIIESVAQRYGDRLKPLLSQVNVGITKNSNRALQACQGELIAFQPGDDVLLPGKVQAQVRWFQEDERRALCGHDVEVFESATGRTLHLHSQATRMREGAGPDLLLRHGSPYVATSVMMRRSAIPSYGFDERIPRVSDYKLWIDCVKNGGVFGFLPDVLARYRIHAGGVTKAASHACWVEEFMVLAIMEAENPDLAGSCASGRAHLYYRSGVSHLLAGEVGESRKQFGRALRSDPLYSARLPLWMMLSGMPERLRARILARRLGGVS
jgi:glycosyltransferase involved in cell wall biosynthesis